MADISKITLPNGSSYDVKDATARNSKTNTSVLPNDSGEIKTKFRMSQKGFTNGATWYYPLCKLPKDDSGNYASAILSGRVGGWASVNMSSVTSLIWNRHSTGIALLDIAGSSTAMSNIWSLCDIVVYTNSDTTDTVYLKCNNYFTFDVDIELFQSSCEILYNGSYVTTTPSGTLAASTSTKKAELINGKLYIAGSELAFTSAIPTKTSQLTNDSGFKTTDNNTTYSLSKSGSTITLTGSDGSTTSVTDTDTNNLTSDSTTDSLSAAQGKVLKGLVDGKAASSHTHTKSQITDFPNSLPASDVYAWAKASTKPSYSYNEITSKPSITPQAYGAKGNGSTNDTSAFTSMLNAISSNGGVVYIPNGTYILNSITIPDNVTLVGESLKAILKQSSTTAHMITLGNNCKIESLSIDGNGTGRTGNYASVYISGKKNCVISNCVLYNGIKWNIYSYSSERVVIENCETYGCVTGAAITITGTNNGYCRINHCYSHNNNLDGFVIAQPFTTIENCYSYQNGTTSVGAAGIFCNDNADFSTINNNIIDSNYGIGIEVAGNSQNMIISKNRVTNNKTDGIEVRQNAQPIITENYLYNNTSAEFSAQISYSVTAGAYYAVINNNIIDCNSQTNYGIYAPNATDCLGTNIIVNANTAPMNVSASSQLGAVKDNQYEYYKRKYVRFTDSRWLNVVNAGSSTNIDIAGNQTFRFVSTDGGYQRVKMINNMSESKPSSPVSGDYYCDASGLHIYRNNTWKTIAYTS